MAFEIRIHDSLEAARPDLRTAGMAGYGFQTLPWLVAWQQTLGEREGTRPLIVVVADTAVRLVIPLAIVRRRGLRVIEFLGGIVTDYNAPRVDPVFAVETDDAAFSVLWTQIVAALPAHDMLHLTRMPAMLDPADAAQPVVRNPLAFLPGMTAAGQALALTLPATTDALERSLRKKFVADMGRCRRRLGEQGAVSLRIAADAHETAETVALLRRMKSRRWGDTGAKDWFADARFTAFYDAMSAAEIADGGIHASTLLCGDVAIAVHLGFVHRGRFYLLMFGWEAGDWQRYGAGRLLVDALVRWAIAERLRVFDFTVGDEAYKREWADEGMPLFACRNPASLRGRLALDVTDRIEQLRRHLKRISWLRAAVRRWNGTPALEGNTHAS